MKQTMNQSGFTLIELIIGAVIMPIIVLAALNLVDLSNRLSSNSIVLQEVNEEAFKKLQEYENREFFAIPSGDSGNSYEVEDFSDDVLAEVDIIQGAVAKVYVQPISASLKKLSVDITYDFASSQRLVDYTTYVQLGGVGR